MTGFRLHDGLTDGIERVLDLRQAQHSLTASNLANADTPGWLAREIPFHEVLSTEVAAAERGQTSTADPEIHELEAPAWAEDGNSVSAEDEAVKLTENSLLYNALSAGLSRRMAILRFAASDGRS